MQYVGACTALHIYDLTSSIMVMDAMLYMLHIDRCGVEPQVCWSLVCLLPVPAGGEGEGEGEVRNSGHDYAVGVPAASHPSGTVHAIIKLIASLEIPFVFFKKKDTFF